MTGFLTGIAIGLACAMWIRWDQTQALKEELAATRRRLHSNDANARWRGIYRQQEQET